MTVKMSFPSFEKEADGSGQLQFQLDRESQRSQCWIFLLHKEYVFSVGMGNRVGLLGQRLLHNSHLPKHAFAQGLSTSLLPVVPRGSIHLWQYFWTRSHNCGFSTLWGTSSLPSFLGAGSCYREERRKENNVYHILSEGLESR